MTAGDPALEATGELLEAIERGGADIIELGVPFSDPLADGPIIQRASERALQGGTTLRKVMQALPGWRKRVSVPLVLFSYYNPILQYGLENFARDASEAGADGVLAVDLTPEESESYVQTLRKWNLDTIFLASPTSTDERLERVASVSTGFLYLISRTGVTGERKEIAANTRPLIQRTRKFTRLPLAVGFGLSTPQQIHAVEELADAAVVGSAVVRAIEERFSAEGAAAIEKYIRWLKQGTGSSPA
ncbi:MAG: tryptophan synthase subunit alpha [Acidobacteria bacterium]|nr:tryptophan synthase subunit alpha [Acidobacteriota bacterium]